MEKSIIKKKTIDFGKIDFFNRGRKINRVEVKVELRGTMDKPVLSVCGNVWNGSKTDIVCGGQCLDSIPLYNNPKFETIKTLA